MFFYIVVIVAGIHITDIGPFLNKHDCLTFKNEVVIPSIKHSFDNTMKYGMNMDRWGFNEIVTFQDYNLECKFN